MFFDSQRFRSQLQANLDGRKLIDSHVVVPNLWILPHALSVVNPKLGGAVRPIPEWVQVLLSQNAHGEGESSNLLRYHETLARQLFELFGFKLPRKGFSVVKHQTGRDNPASS